MKYLGFVVARKGSKGLLGKNLKLLNGKPLIQYSFEAAINAKSLSEVHISTDDESIVELAKKFGVNSLYLRPAELASDESSIIDVIQYHLNWLESNDFPFPENIVLLQPTSPIRSEKLIDNCISTFEQSGKHSLIAVSHCIQHPYEMFQIKDSKLDYFNKTPQRRQEYPNFFFITGSLYIASTNYIRQNNKLFDEYSATYLVSNKEAVDIDEEVDIRLAEFYLKDI
jgi:CMP-N,N'-diacetyllegionaminic acid synthase